MGAKCLKFVRCFICGYEASDRRRRQQGDTRRGLRNRDVADMADLAMLLVGGVSVPVPGCLHGKQAHRNNQGNGQPSRCYMSFHRKLCKKSAAAFDARGRGQGANFKPARRLPRAPPVRREPDSRKIQGPGVKSTRPRSRSQMAFGCPSRCRWKARREAGRDRRQVRSS
jgi:hypothetical protein